VITPDTARSPHALGNLPGETHHYGLFHAHPTPICVVKLRVNPAEDVFMRALARKCGAGDNRDAIDLKAEPMANNSVSCFVIASGCSLTEVCLAHWYLGLERGRYRA
jgi:hypothetical protein